MHLWRSIAYSISLLFLACGLVNGQITTTPVLTPDTDGALSANSDTRVATQKAAKTYSDTKQASGNYLTDPGGSGVVQRTGLNTTSAVITPVTLFVKNVTLLTAGAPADIATIAIPTWITRYSQWVGNNAVGGGWRMYSETASGTLAGATFSPFDASGGGGNQLGALITGPTAVSMLVVGNGGSTGNTAVSTSGTIYIRQNANSANAGTASFYITIFPMP